MLLSELVDSFLVLLNRHTRMKYQNISGTVGTSVNYIMCGKFSEIQGGLQNFLLF
jgi:hypothetical protein